ncbi:MAG: peptide deformylase, partial [bacterium]|nr:peptide deformylase [bacterium]
SDMAEALDRYPEGVAIAAPQIGVSYRLFIVRKDRVVFPPPNAQGSTLAQNSQGQTLAAEVEIYINPEIVKTSRKRAQVDEGCLSVHGVYGTTSRHERATVKARLPDGSHIQRGASGLMAQIFEHEVDHLNGILFIDHAERLIRTPRGPARSFVYFGTPDFSALVLDELVEAGFVPATIITAPDRPAGRGLALAEPPVKGWARAHDIRVLQPETFDEAMLAELSKGEAYFAVVAAYGKILPPRVLDLFPGGAFNVHPSLLPRYRGTSPVESQILADEHTIGVSVIQMDEKMDHGPVVAQEEVFIPGWPIDRNTANAFVWKAGGKLLASILPDWLNGSATITPQDESRATFTNKITREDGEIKLSAPARQNYLKYLAYSGWPGTYFFENGRRVKIVKASFKNKTFVIERVIPEGKREMEYAKSQQTRKSM